MRTVFEIEAREIERVDYLTTYNHIMWKFKVPQKNGITHFYEDYDDVGLEPSYRFGAFINGYLETYFCGEGEAVPAEKIGYGGVWFRVHVFD